MGLVIFTEDKAHILYLPLPNTHTHTHVHVCSHTQASLNTQDAQRALVGEWLVVQDSRGQAAHLVSITHLLCAGITH